MLLTDFETRSTADLRAVGSYRYATHPDTDIICCAFKLGEHEWLWRNPKLYDTGTDSPQSEDGRFFTPHHLSMAFTSDMLVAAHNAGFDRLIWEHVAVKRYGFPPIPLVRWYCTSAMCRVNGLPAGLDDAARAVGGDMRKDFRGAELIRKCSIPPFSEDPEDLAAMAEYCQQDLRVQAHIMDACRPLTENEHQDWLVNERINDRGVQVDRPLAELATHYAEEETEAIRAELHRQTNGQISGHAQHARIKAWLFANTPEAAHKYMYVYKGGVKKECTDKAVRAELLGRADELDLSDRARYVLELVTDGNRSSVSKFQSMLDRSTDEDPRVRGAFMYAGAASTLRFSSRGLQLHNMRRDATAPGETEQLRRTMQEDGPLEDVMDTLSRLLRPTLVPRDGYVFVVGDWSAIEARALPWLAGHEAKLDVFRAGKDIYEATAAKMGPDFDRQTGKVAELSLGYGGGTGAFAAMGRNYGLFLPEHQAQRIVDRWRVTNYWAPEFWRKLKQAAHAAVRQPGMPILVNDRITYVYHAHLLGGALLCLLPGDTILTYPQVRFEEDQFGEPCLTALKAAWTPKADAREWPRVTLWHGLLAENVTQAFCAGVLRWALREFDTGPWDSTGVVMHTHDEGVIETPERHAEDVRAYMTTEMNRSPPFAPDLPLSAEPVIMTRYGKP